MAKFTAEEKIKIIKRYINGKESYRELSNEFNVSHKVIQEWVTLYQHQGASGFVKGYTSYSLEFKLDVLKYMNEMGTSSNETAANFNLGKRSPFLNV